MNSLWDEWFVDPFLTHEQMERKYGRRCKHCHRYCLQHPFCPCYEPETYQSSGENDVK